MLPAADAVSLEVQHGEFMVLLGPSGCGKTTTLRMIAGLESISSGTLSIDGRTVNQVPAKDRDIAMVFQSYALYPHMSVKDNLAFGLQASVGADAPRSSAALTAVADTLGLSGLLDRKPHALSGGQRQRVALGRAIVRDPKVFLFDEPLSNLDAALRVSTRGELGQAASPARRHHDLRHARPGGGDDAGQPHLHHERRQGGAGRRAAGGLPASGQYLCCGASSAIRR